MRPRPLPLPPPPTRSPPLTLVSRLPQPAPPSRHPNSAGLILDALDNKKGSVKGLCMAEANKGRRAGEGARFLKVVVECLKCQSPSPFFVRKCHQTATVATIPRP